MSPNDEIPSAPMQESSVIRHRGRDLAKFVGAVVFVLAGLALVCRSVWDFRDEWILWNAPTALSARVAVTTSDDWPLALGQRVYQARCVSCHGPAGHGDGPEVAKSQVRPRDLASASWHSGASRDAVRRVISEGTHDKSMPGFAGAMSAHELDGVVDYVFSLKITNLLTRAGFIPEMGQSAPPLFFRDPEGTVGSLEKLRGKVVLVAFWGTTCVPCIAELPELESLANRYEKTDFVVLPVCVDDTNAGTARQVAARHAPRLPVYVDPDGSAREYFNVHHLPEATLIDREGRMLGRSYQAKGWAGKGFEQVLSAGLGLRPHSTSEDDAEL
jgi:mono/diheme cytochrome c family protein/peroxiredoxin